MVSKASASSRNSSLRPGSRMRWESDPVAAMRVASVMRVRGASMRPARIHPPTRPNTSRIASTAAALGAKMCRRSERTGKTLGVGVRVDEERAVGDVTQEEQPHGAEQQGAREHEEPGVAEGELEADAQSGRSSHARLPHARCLVDVDAVPGAGHGGDDRGFAEAFAQCRDRDAHGVGERVGVLVPRPRQELLGADDAAFGGDEDFEHRELLPGQRDVAAVAVDLAAERIQPQTRDLSHGRPVWARLRSSARRRSTSSWSSNGFVR